MKRKRAEQTTEDVVRTVLGPQSPRNSNLLKERHVNEDSLVAAARRGHRAAFDQLCEHSSRKVLRATYRITRNQEDAEDALQDAFLKAFVHLKTFDGRSNFSTWLTRIAINSALMILRKRRQGREISVDEFAERNEAGLAWEISDPSASPETHFAQEEREKLLWGAIGELRPSLRKVIEFQLSRDCAMKKTADTIGISVCAAKSRLFHAKSALRKSLRMKYVAACSDRGLMLRFVRDAALSADGTGSVGSASVAGRRKVG
jgi:RNA polymerase sigma factor (sigma-70 family)